MFDPAEEIAWKTKVVLANKRTGQRVRKQNKKKTWWTANLFKCDGLISLDESFNSTFPAFILTIKLIRNVQTCFVEKFKSDGYFIYWFVSWCDMFNGNMAVLVEFHNFHLSHIGQNLVCGQIF